MALNSQISNTKTRTQDSNLDPYNVHEGKSKVIIYASGSPSFNYSNFSYVSC